jgi:hypothetical protein
VGCAIFPVMKTKTKLKAGAKQLVFIEDAG